MPTSSRTDPSGRTGDEAGREGGSASFVPDEAERTRAPPMMRGCLNRCMVQAAQEFDRQIATPLPWLGGVAAKQLTAYERSLAHARTRPRRGDTEAMLRFVSEARFFSPTSSAGELLTWLGEQGPGPRNHVPSDVRCSARDAGDAWTRLSTSCTPNAPLCANKENRTDLGWEAAG